MSLLRRYEGFIQDAMVGDLVVLFSAPAPWDRTPSPYHWKTQRSRPEIPTKVGTVMQKDVIYAPDPCRVNGAELDHDDMMRMGLGTMTPFWVNLRILVESSPATGRARAEFETMCKPLWTPLVRMT